MTMIATAPMTDSTEAADNIIALLDDNRFGVTPREALGMADALFSVEDHSLHIVGCLVQVNPDHRGNITITPQDKQDEFGQDLYAAVFAPSSLMAPATTHANLSADELMELLAHKAGLFATA